MREVYHFYIKLPLLVRLSIIVLAILYTCAFFAHIFEPSKFTTVFEGFYWAVITAGTVGYGDYAPDSTIVRIIAIILVFIGSSYLIFFTAHIVGAIIKKENRFFEGKTMYKNANHTIFVGWNERTSNIIRSLLKRAQTQNIVLIDDSLMDNPLYKEGVFFIKGKASEDKTWFQANIQEGECVVISADPNLTESLADLNTVVSILAVRGLHSTIPIHAEILTSTQISNAKRAGANHIIHTSLLAAEKILNTFEK